MGPCRGCPASEEPLLEAADNSSPAASYGAPSAGRKLIAPASPLARAVADMAAGAVEADLPLPPRGDGELKSCASDRAMDLHCLYAARRSLGVL